MSDKKTAPKIMIDVHLKTGGIVPLCARSSQDAHEISMRILDEGIRFKAYAINGCFPGPCYYPAHQIEMITLSELPESPSQ